MCMCSCTDLPVGLSEQPTQCCLYSVSLERCEIAPEGNTEQERTRGITPQNNECMWGCVCVGGGGGGGGFTFFISDMEVRRVVLLEMLWVTCIFRTWRLIPEWSDICSGDNCSCDDNYDNKELEWGWLLGF